MRPNRFSLVALTALVLAVPAAAAVRGPALTVYGRDLALVRESRMVDLRGADDTLRITDLPAALDFSSVRVDLPGNARVLRLAWRNDVDNGDHMLDAARGSRVRVRSRGDRTTDGALLAADPSWLVLRGDDGAVSTLSRSAVEEVRLLTPPAALSLRPTLEVVPAGGARGRGEAELSYLTGGLSWSAEHVLVRSGESGGTWSASVQVENNSGRDYVDASLKLVAGQIARTAPPVAPLARAGQAMEMMMKTQDLSEQSFSEYHLYTLDRPATLRDREAQSLTMIDPRPVEPRPRYLFRGDGRNVLAQLELVNESPRGPGVPLPAGRVRIYERDASGALQLAGETRINHTASGEKLTLDVGSAFDLVGEKKVTAERRISDREREFSVETRLRNRKRVAVTILCEESVGGEWEVTQKNHEFARKDANTIQFAVPVEPGKESVLTYTVHVRY